MAIAWALLVVSSGRQSDTLQYQRAWADGVCADKGWELTRYVEGVASGKDGPRRLSRELVLEVQAAPVEARPKYVLMIRLDRVGRGSIVDSQLFVRDLLVLGARIYTRDQGEIKLDSAMDELIAAVQLAVARHENDVRCDKARAVYRRRRDAGQVTSNRSPYGLRLTKERQFEAVPEYIPCITAAYRMLGRGVGMMKVVRWLQSHSEPQRYGNGHEYTVRWSDRRLAIMIAHRGYCGTVVDESTWLRAQRPRLSRSIGRTPRHDRRYPEFFLANVFRCSCGRRLSCVVNVTAKGIAHRYYICRAGWTHPRAKYHVASRLEERFASFLRDIAKNAPSRLRSSNEGYAANVESAIRRLRDELRDVESRRVRVWRLDEVGHLTDRDLEERMSFLNGRKTAIETQLVAMLEERAHIASLAIKDAETESLRQTAFSEFLAANFLKKNDIARAVSASFGGLRVGMDGRILTGPKPDHIWLRKKRQNEI